MPDPTGKKTRNDKDAWRWKKGRGEDGENTALLRHCKGRRAAYPRAIRGPGSPRMILRRMVWACGGGENKEAIREGAALLRHRRLVAGHLAAFGVRRGGGTLRGDDPRFGTSPGARGARARQRRRQQRLPHEARLLHDPRRARRPDATGSAATSTPNAPTYQAICDPSAWGVPSTLCSSTTLLCT